MNRNTVLVWVLSILIFTSTSLNVSAVSVTLQTFGTIPPVVNVTPQAMDMIPPAVSACNATGGTITAKNKEYSYGLGPSTCAYFAGIECTDYDAYQGKCLPQYLFFGSLHWWPTRIIYLAILLTIFVKYKKRKKQQELTLHSKSV